MLRPPEFFLELAALHHIVVPVQHRAGSAAELFHELLQFLQAGVELANPLPLCNKIGNEGGMNH